MKHLDETWKNWIGNIALAIIQEKIMWEDYIRTEKGAQEAVELMFALFVFCAIDGLWATYNLLSAIC